MGAYQNAGNMTCWAHRELAAVDEETKKNMETAWEAENDKDECIVNLEGPERNYWLGSEAEMLGCYWFSRVAQCLRGMGRITKEEWGREHHHQ